MLLPKALKKRAIKDRMPLVADSIRGTKCAPAQMLIWDQARNTMKKTVAQNHSPGAGMASMLNICMWAFFGA